MELTRDEESIIAQCTPQGNGALALLRLCGVDALSCAQTLARLTSNRTLSELPTHTIHHGHVVDERGALLDEVLFLVTKAPHTFTGQDTVEITCHNNQFIIQSILDAALVAGARLARPGEFTQRAMLSGKMDILKAEALHDVIHAPTQQALKASQQQLRGSLSSHIADLEQRLLHVYAYSEASFEFLDEEQRDLDFDAEVKEKLTSVAVDVKSLLEQFSVQDHMRQGVRVALVGTVNAGKSTLFNALLKKERSIVTEIEGTTRDTVEASMHKGTYLWTFVDTAGLRKTEDVVEQEGIRRSKHEAAQADVVVLVIDSSVELSDELVARYKELIDDKTIVVASKSDLRIEESGAPEKSSWPLRQDPGEAAGSGPESLSPNILYVSAHTGQGLEQLEQEIERRIEEQFKTFNAPYLLNKRHHALLVQTDARLSKVLDQLTGPIEYELLSVHLKEVLEILSELTGKVISEKMMDTVFSSFCVGK